MKKLTCSKCKGQMYGINSFLFNKWLYDKYDVNQTTKEEMVKYDNMMICERCLHELTDKIKKEHFLNTGTECLGVAGAYIAGTEDWRKKFENTNNI